LGERTLPLPVWTKLGAQGLDVAALQAELDAIPVAELLKPSHPDTLAPHKALGSD
jgi:hypothetical protein